MRGILLSILMLLLMGACSKDDQFAALDEASQITAEEEKVIEECPFEECESEPPPVFSAELTGINDADDSILPINFNGLAAIEEFLADPVNNFVKRCDASKRREEFTNVSQEVQAMNNAGGDQYMLVEFSYSFGNVSDDIAMMAFLRAILHKQDQGNSIIAVGADSEEKFYKVDHSAAKAHYENGERCFYSYVKISSDVTAGMTGNGELSNLGLDLGINALYETVKDVLPGEEVNYDRSIG